MPAARAFSILLLTTLLATAPWHDAQAQLERRRAAPPGPVELTFMAPRHISLLTVEPLGAGELHYSIMHTFGEVSSGGRNLWGIDNGANVRLSLEYAPSDRLSWMFGRSSEDKSFDLGGRWHWLRQMEDDSVPVSVTVSGGIGYTGDDYAYLAEDYTFQERFNGQAWVHAARKFSPDLSLQLSAGAAHFRRVGRELRLASPVENTYFGAGVSGRYRFAPRVAATFQAIPRVYGNESDVVLGAGIDIETGGHVFQLYLITFNALNDAYALAGANGGISDGAFRFGFNVNRIFNVR